MAPAEAAMAEVHGGDVNGKLTAAQRKKLKAKQRQRAKKEERSAISKLGETGARDEHAEKKPPTIEVEYVSEPLELELELEEAAAAARQDGGSGPAKAAGGSGRSDEAAAAAAAAVAEAARIRNALGRAEALFGGIDDEDAAGGPDEVGRAAGGRGDDEGGGPSSSSSDEEGEDDEDSEEAASAHVSAPLGPDGAPLSRKKARHLARERVAELKRLAPRPDVVEVWDASASDPELLVRLKSLRNTVPVPQHWSQKRGYLQGKKGLDKPTYELPDAVAATGIGEMRQAYHDKAEAQSLKQTARARMAPRVGKLDIDYRVLHDAFFGRHGKPRMTGWGDLYYEGKEWETRMEGVAVPGKLSPDLLLALGVGPDDPPPWLVNQQRYGPPPSYPGLRVPGLNAPIPAGASFGYHPGGWGKPPVDVHGRPLYGDPFGLGAADNDPEDIRARTAPAFGELEEESEEESEEEEEEEEEAGEEGEGGEAEGEREGEEGRAAEGADARRAAALASGTSSTLPADGLRTPGGVELRKASTEGAGGDAPAQPAGQPKALYRVLKEKAHASGAGGLLGSDHVYVLSPEGEAGGAAGAAAAPPVAAPAAPRPRHRPGGAAAAPPAPAALAIDPDELEGLSEEELRALYQDRLGQTATREDLSDMVAAAAAAQKRKSSERAAGKEAKRAKQ